MGGFVDCVEVDPCGLIRIVGWSNTDVSQQSLPSVSLDGQPVPFLQHFRFTRPDVVPNGSAIPSQVGVMLEYLVPEAMLSDASIVEVNFPSNTCKFLFQANLRFVNPHYRPMLDSGQVQHREDIYGSGPPNAAVDPQVLELAQQLKGPVLDFGCGRGALVHELLQSGTEAHGLELDCEMIRSAIAAENKPHITLYNGALPAPFGDDSFRSVICSEVLEHIPDFQAAIRDIARIAGESAIFTVPDASAIAIGYRHGAIPWHLLESSHVNFFNQQSLKRALEPHFSKVDFGRIGECRFNDSVFYFSLAAVCTK